MNSKYLRLILIIIVLTGCGTTKYYEKQQSIDLLNAKQQEVTVRVLAKAAEWMNSGVIVRAGQQYKIEATGKWHGGLICGWTGPDGMGASQICFCNIVPGWSISTLIARISDEGIPFAVGSDYTFVASHYGVLQFHINDPTGDSLADSHCWPYTKDNQGFVNVKISIPQVKQDVIDVKIVGYDDGIKTTKQKDYREALINAMRQAIERAGVEVESKSKVKNFELEDDYIETSARAILLPGFEIIDIGYSEGHTYTVMLVGKIKVSGLPNR
ncbi:MAG: hypothetical protein ABFD82_00760 [Syntrophaceae bacterium]